MKKLILLVPMVLISIIFLNQFEQTGSTKENSDLVIQKMTQRSVQKKTAARLRESMPGLEANVVSAPEAIKLKIRKIDNRLEKLQGRLHNQGYPYILNRNYLSKKERQKIYKWASQAQNLKNQKIHLQIQLIKLETEV